ncbi:MAG: hypothetical protein V1869_00160 [Candidatus Omnitrophota bacterium]
MNKISIIFLIFCFIIAPAALADESGDKSISGTVSSVDWIKSVLSVRYTDPYTGDSDEIALKVTGDSELTRGTESILLFDVEQGDPVSITYYKDDLSGLKIRNLSDLNDANE